MTRELHNRAAGAGSRHAIATAAGGEAGGGVGDDMYSAVALEAV